MMVRLFSVMRREVKGIHEAAYLLAGFAFLSQILALVRDRILAVQFGAGQTLDIYYAGFRIPDLLFATVASLLSLYALLPILARLEQEKEGRAVSFLRDALLLFFVGMAAIAAVLYVFVPELVGWVAPGIAGEPAARDQFILLVRILLLQPILLGLSNTLAALTQLRHRFVLYSVSPLLYNLGIIFGAMVLYPEMGIAGLGWGVVLGAFLHMIVQIPFFVSEVRQAREPISNALSGLREVLALSIPRTLALSAGQVSLIALVSLASLLSPGSIAVFTFALNLQAVPLTIIGVSYSVAAFPTLARLFAQGKRAEFASHIEAAVRHMIFWSIPAVVFVVVLRAQLVRVILGAGAFDWTATRLTAAALALFIISLAAQSISLLIARSYYAAGNTRKPLYFGTLEVVVTVTSSLWLILLFHQNELFQNFIESLLRVSDISGTSVLMLPLAFSLGSIVKFVVSFVFFVRDFSLSARGMVVLAFQSFSASIIGGSVSYIFLTLTGAAGTINTTIGLVSQGMAAGLSGLVVTGSILWLLNNTELKEALGAFTRYFKKETSPVVMEPSDISSTPH